MAANTPEADAAHWIKSRNLTGFVLVVWLIFSLGVHVFAQYLNQFSFIGFPLGYYMAVQGSLIVFVALIFFQNGQQDSIDETYGQGE